MKERIRLNKLQINSNKLNKIGAWQTDRRTELQLFCIYRAVRSCALCADARWLGLTRYSKYSYRNYKSSNLCSQDLTSIWSHFYNVFSQISKPRFSRTRRRKNVCRSLDGLVAPLYFVHYIGMSTEYTPRVKKTRHQTLGHNFTNYYPIFKIFSLADSAVNLQQTHV